MQSILFQLLFLLKLLSAFPTSKDTTTPTRHKRQKHQQSSSTAPKAKVEMTRIEHKLFTNWQQLRNIQCPVCSHQELANCPILQRGGNIGESCQLPKYSTDCSCCPKCLSKEGETCGQIVDERNPGYSAGLQDCEEGLRCTSLLSQGVCEKLQDYVYEPSMWSDYENYEYNIQEYNDQSQESYIQSLPLQSGCENHHKSISTLEVFYPGALGVRLWSPNCQESNPDLYQPIQCRFKEQAVANPDEVCWCVDEQTGSPTIHMHWDKREVKGDFCQMISNSYELSHKKV